MDFLHDSTAFVFDMDGLLLDTERLANAALHSAARDLGAELPEDVFMEMIGRRGTEIHRRLALRIGDETLARELLDLSERHYEVALARGVPVKPGVRELLEILERLKRPCAVATSTRTAKAERKLAAAGLRSFFATVVGGDLVEHGKPAPDIYLRAAQLLSVAPATCTVFEDSDPGLCAAHAAGATVVWVPDLAPVSLQTQARVTARVESLATVVSFLNGGSRP